MMTPEQIARWFHESYESLAPEFGYKTREASAVDWDEVPEANRRLMIAVAKSVAARILTAATTHEGEPFPCGEGHCATVREETIAEQVTLGAE